MNVDQRTLLNKLLDARRVYLEQHALALEAKRSYDAAEDAYLRAVAPADQTKVPSVVLQGTAVVAYPDWFDRAKGDRLKYHKVEVIA